MSVFLSSLRLSPLFMMAPVFGSIPMPIRVRVMVVLALSAMMVLGLKTEAPVFHSTTDFILAAVSEVVLGGALAFGLFAAFGAFLWGGRLLDMQIGFGVANLFDPITRAQAPLLGTALNMMAVAIFFAIDGHHWLIRGLAASFQYFPPGNARTEFDISAFSAQFGLMFSLGLALVAPVVFMLLLMDIALAAVSRTMPQVNIFIVSMPLKIVLGIFVLAVSLKYIRPVLDRIFGSVFTFWERVLS